MDAHVYHSRDWRVGIAMPLYKYNNIRGLLCCQIGVHYIHASE